MNKANKYRRLSEWAPQKRYAESQAAVHQKPIPYARDPYQLALERPKALSISIRAKVYF
jgi:hypothetical protein